MGRDSLLSRFSMKNLEIEQEAKPGKPSTPRNSQRKAEISDVIG